MDKEKLEIYVRSLLPMPPEKARQLIARFELLELPRNEFLLRENKISERTYFLENGYARSYTFDNNGEEVTTHIFAVPCFVNDFLSFFKQQPTRQNFQTLTDCRLWTQDYQAVQQYFHLYPEFREFGRMILVHNYDLLNERMLGMIRDTAETRYLKLLERQPDIFQNVPLKIIASYLGITSTSLSRIRKEIQK